MKINSPFVVVAIGVVFVISAFLRLFGFSVPSLVVAIISVVAALISFSDLLEITKFKKHRNLVRAVALVVFTIGIILWLFNINSNLVVIQYIGDCFTLMGLGFVIGLYGWKEILEHKNVIDKNEINTEYRFRLTKKEYDEMMRVNDIIERLKRLDQEFLPFNKVHDGWGLFNETLTTSWNSWKGPFYDGMNREKHSKFLNALDKITDLIGDMSDPDSISFDTRNIKMWEDAIDVVSRPIIHNSYASMDDVYEEIQKALLLWTDVKNSITNRYEKERAGN